jgi:hypothetical protein
VSALHLSVRHHRSGHETACGLYDGQFAVGRLRFGAPKTAPEGWPSRIGRCKRCVRVYDKAVHGFRASAARWFRRAATDAEGSLMMAAQTNTGLVVGDRVKLRDAATAQGRTNVGRVVEIVNESIVYVRWPGTARFAQRAADLEKISQHKPCPTCLGSGIMSDFSGFEYTCRECLGHKTVAA